MRINIDHAHGFSFSNVRCKRWSVGVTTSLTGWGVLRGLPVACGGYASPAE